MIIYLDTSALIKRYIRETGSTDARGWIQSADGIGTSEITKVEMASAIARLIRAGQVSEHDGQLSWKDFENDWSFINVLLVSTEVVERAVSLTRRHRLRAYDAVHLAAALIWQEALAEPVTLATFDHELWQAARQDGMHVYPAAS